VQSLGCHATSARTRRECIRDQQCNEPQRVFAHLTTRFTFGVSFIKTFIKTVGFFLLLLADCATANENEANIEPSPLMTRKGQLIFSEDFAGADIDKKWVRPKGNWSIVAGALQGGERKEDHYSGSCKVDFEAHDVIVQFDLLFNGASKANFAIDSPKGHIGRLTIAPNGFTVQKDASSTDESDGRRVLDTSAFDFQAGQWYSMTVEICGEEILAWIDDRHFVVGSDPKFKREKSRIAFGVHGEFIRIDNVKAYVATSNPDWPATKSRHAKQHADPPIPPVIGPDHYKNAKGKK